MNDRICAALWERLSAPMKRGLTIVASEPYVDEWVMAKSTRGVLLERGFIEWHRPDPRSRITLRITDEGRSLIEWAERS